MAPGAGGHASVGQWVGEIGLTAVPLVLAIMLHEVAHGAVAFACGDPTAARAGRLTLNPLRHVDPVGTVLLPGMLLLAPLLFGTRAFVFGWAKPVPVDVRRLRHPRRDGFLVALAGPGTNLLLALVSAFGVVGLTAHGHPTGAMAWVTRLLWASFTVNCVLAVFNLMPVPPLDGGRVLAAVLPPSAAGLLRTVERFGLLIVMLIVMNGNVVGRLVRPVMALILMVAGAWHA